MGALTEGRFAEVTNTGCGTPEFIAPEIYKGELYSYNVDMWSLGVMAFKMIVGRVRSIISSFFGCVWLTF